MGFFVNGKNAVNVSELEKKYKPNETRTFYQQNLAMPSPQEEVTTRGMLGKIVNIAANDKEQGLSLFEKLQKCQSDPSTPLYNPFLQATNPSIQTLANLGFDVSNIDDKWFDDNAYLMNYYETSNTTNNVKAPTKKSSTLSQAAYAYNQLLDARETSNKALQELNAAMEEAATLAQMPDRNYSDDQIVEMVYGNEKKYPTLAKMEKSKLSGEPIELNFAVPYSKDALYGAVWMGRNPDYKGDLNGAMANSYNGVGNVWKEDSDVQTKLTKGDQYAPYSLGSTLDDERLYFKQLNFTNEWVDANYAKAANSQDETERKMYSNVYEANEKTKALEAELDAMYTRFNDLVGKRGYTAEQALNVIKKDTNSFGELFKLDETMKSPKGNLVKTTRPINYKWEDFEKNALDWYADQAKGSSTVEFTDEMVKSLTGTPSPAQTPAASPVTTPAAPKATPATTPAVSPAPTTAQVTEQAEKENIEAVTPAIAKNGTDEQKLIIEVGRSLQFAASVATLQQIVPQNEALRKSAADSLAAKTSETYIGDLRVIRDYEQTESALKQSQDRLNFVMREYNTLNNRFEKSGNVNAFDTAFVDWIQNDPDWEEIKANIQSDDAGKKAMGYQAFNGKMFEGQFAAVGDHEDIFSQMSVKDGKLQGVPEKIERLADAAIKGEVNPEGNTPLTAAEEDTMFAFEEEMGELQEEIRSLTADLNGKQKAYNDAKNDRDRLLTSYAENEKVFGDQFDKTLLDDIDTAYQLSQNYDPTTFTADNVYDMAVDEGVEKSEVVSQARLNMAGGVEALERLKRTMGNIDRYKIPLSADERKNLQQRITNLEREVYGNAAFLLDEQKDFEKIARAQMSKGYEDKIGGYSDLTKANIDAMTTGYLGNWLDNAPVLAQYIPLDEFQGQIVNDPGNRYLIADVLRSINEREKLRYFYLLSEEGEDAANRYFQHLVNPEYGTLWTRSSQDRSEEIREKMSQSGWNALGGYALSFVTNVYGNMEAALTSAEDRLTGTTSHPYGEKYALTNFTTDLRGGAQDYLHKKFGESEFLDTVFNAGTSAVDSMISSLLTTGGMDFLGEALPVFKKIQGFLEVAGSGKYGGMAKFGANAISDWEHAIPMALGAAAQRDREAVIQGATPEQRRALFLSTFFAESVSEALTYGNIKGMFEKGATQELKGFFKSLMSNGMEEALGEGFNQWWENNAETAILGSASEYGRLLDYYKNELKLPQSVAEDLAEKEMVKSVLLAAASGFISSGFSSTSSYVAGSAVNTIRSPYSASDITKRDTAILNFAGRYNQPTNASISIAAILGTDMRPEEAKAVAQHIVGGGSVPQAVGLMQGVISNENPQGKQAVAYAAMTSGVANRTLQDLTQKAKEGLPITEADVNNLVAAVAEDKSGPNAEAIAKEMKDKIRENRIANKTLEKAATPENKKALDDQQAKVDEAQKKKDDADAKLEDTKGQLVTATQNAQDAITELENNPQDTANIGTVQQTAEQVAALQDKVQEETKNSEDAQEEVAKAEEEQTKVENTVVAQATEEATVETDQEMANETEQEKLDAEIREKAIAAERENRNFSRLDAEEFVRQNFPNLSPEDQEYAINRVMGIQMAMSQTSDSIMARGRFADAFAKKYGLKRKYVENAFFNAKIDPKTGTLTINKNASQSDIIYAVLIHEITHIAESSDTYNDLADAVLQMRYGEGVTFNGILSQMESGDVSSRLAQDILSRKALYDETLTKQTGEKVDLTNLEALQEIVADGVGYVIAGDQAAIDQLVAEKPSLARRILDSIKSFLKKAVGIEDETITQAQRVADMLETALNGTFNEASNAKYMLRDSGGNVLQINQSALQENKNKVNAMSPGLTISAEDYQDLLSGDFIENGLRYFNTHGDLAVNPILGDVLLDKYGLRHITAQKNVRAIKAMTIPAIKHVIENGELVHIDNDHKGNDTAIIVEKVNMPDANPSGYYYVGVLVTQTNGGTRGQQNKYSFHSAYALNENAAPSPNAIGRMDSESPVTVQDSVPIINILHEIAGINSESGQSAENSGTPLAMDSNGDSLATELSGGTVAAGLPMHEDGTDGERYSLSSWTPTEVSKVRKNLLKNGFTAQQADKWIADVNSIAAVIAADKERLDFTPDRTQKFKKPNGDVYKWTLDASTLCAKRLLYQGTFNAIQKLMPNTPLYAGDLIELSNMMREMGYQTPCGICYVESQRRDTGKFTEQFLEKYSKEHQGEFIPTYADLTTSDGLYKLRDEHKDVYDAYIKANNARGSASTKPVQLRTDYRGDVRSLTKDSIEYLKSIGGLRIQSFSDFETPHLMDMMQAVLDMAAVRLTSQAYTKVPNFAWVFGDTGIKINLSLMGDENGVDENGNLIFSSTEGMDFDEAMKLRDRYSQNVGTILVGMNDAHILAAMADPRIDYIIPFHRSGWSEENRQKMTSLANYKDYQDYQNERDIKTGKKTDSNLEPVGPNGYWDYNKTGKENAEEYLRLCAEKGLIPKFEQFLVNNGDGSYSLQPDGSTDGYWKTLIDFKMYDNEGVGAPQQEVTPNINMPEAFRVLGEFDGMGVNSLPVADPVVERYVEEYKANHPRERYSLPNQVNPNFTNIDGTEATNEQVENSDITVRYSLRTVEPPKKTIKCYKAFYVEDGKLYPPMVSNNTNPDEIQKGKKHTSGTMRGLETPVGVWLDADVGGLAVDKDTGEPMRTDKTGRLRVKNDKGGDSLAFRPGWHLGEWPDATQFNKKDPVTGKEKALMPDDLVFAECEIAADYDYQLEAFELGVSENGKFNRTQAGLPRVPVDGYYKYRTNADPNMAPWYITGAMKVTRILDDEDCRQICAEYGVTPGERYSHHDIDLEAYGLKKGEVTPTEDLGRFEKNQASYDNDAMLEKALNDERYRDAYVRRALDFDDPTLMKEFGIDGISEEDVAKYRESYAPSDDVIRPVKKGRKSKKNRERYSLPAVKPSDAPYLSAVDHGDMETAEKYVKADAEGNGYTDEAYHGSPSFGFTEFDLEGGQGTIFVAYNENVARTYSDDADVKEIGKGRKDYYNMLTDELLDELAKTNSKRLALKGSPVVSSEYMTQAQIADFLEDVFNKGIRALDGMSWDDVASTKDTIVNSAARETSISQARLEACETPKELAELLVRNAQNDPSPDGSGFNILSYLLRAGARINMEGEDTKQIFDVLHDLDQYLSYAYSSYYSDGAVKVQNGDGETGYWSLPTVASYLDADSSFGTYRLYTRPGNQLEVDAEGALWSEIPFNDPDYETDELTGAEPIRYMKTREIAEWAREHGYDSVRINNVRDSGSWGMDGYGDIGIFFNKEDVKSADTVTYDDDGNVIPLSERFSDQRGDIRYSLPSDDILDQRIRQYFAGLAEQTNLPDQAQPVEDGNAQRQFGSRTAQQSDALHQEVKDYLFRHSSYTPDTNRDQIDRAMDWVASMATTNDPDGYQAALNEVTSEAFDYRSADGQARMLTVMGMAALKNDLNAELRLADAYNKQGTDLGRQLQARKIFRLMTPIGRQSVLQQQIDQINEQYAKEGITTRVGLPDYIFEAAGAAQTEEEFQRVRRAAARELASQMPANWKDKLRGWRMLAMLGNPRTHIRNVIGNALFIPAVSLKNKMGAIGEMVTGQDQRTKTLTPILPKEIRDFARQDAVTMKDTLTGEAKYNEESMVERERRNFRGLLQTLSDFNSNALEAEDWFFLKGHYRRALGGWMQANGYTPEQLRSNPALLEQGRAYAIQEAQKATYRDFNQLASTLNQVSRNGGVAGFLVEAALPFKKTPANILKRGLEYSIVGTVKALTTDAFHLKQYMDYQNGKLEALPEKAISPNQFIDNLCSGLTGTAVMAVGAILSSMGVVSCGLDDDDDEFEKAKGNQKYSVKFSLFGQDVTFTMDWAAPMSMPFFVGAAIQEQYAKEGEVDLNGLINSIGKISEPVFNLSMLDGMNSLFKTSQYDDTNSITQILAKLGLNYATSFVPSLLGATARTIDPYRRKAFVESGQGTGPLGTARYTLEQTENKIPGLSQTNIPYRDVWGNPETSGVAERILENFVLPGYINEYKDDPVINELGRLYEATGEKAMIPSEPGKTITFNKEKYILTDKQWDAYKEARGKTAHELLTGLLDNPEYLKASEKVQAEMVKSAWSYADQVGKKAAVPEYEVEELGPDPVTSIANDGAITGYKAEMMKALKAGDMETYLTTVEALHEAGAEDSTIKNQIANTYRDLYKDAYRKGRYDEMVEIENLLYATGFSFDTAAWEKAVDEKYGTP